MNPAAEGPRLRPRFKGIENFLRRIAFNLGNTPSQTEVKVISCVPIDVTDLQNKIVELEKELDARHTGHTIATALGVPVFSAQSQPLPQEPPPPPELNDQTTPYPNLSTSTNLELSTKTINQSRDETKPQIIRERHRAKKKKHKENIQMVYFAQANNSASPFKVKAEERKRRNVVPEPKLSRSYVEDVVRRQYSPAEPSSSSHFSWPVCRDEPAPDPAPRDSDLCSCCHNGYQDLDASPDAPFPAPHPTEYSHRECNHYYDSSMYDLVPVRDTPFRIIEEREEDVYYRDTGNAVRRERSPNKAQRPPGVRPQPQTVMYATVPPIRAGHKLRYKARIPTKSTFKRDQVLKTMQRRRAEPRPGTEASRTSCVECGDLYAKVIPRAALLTQPQAPTPTPPPPPPPPPPRPLVELKNAECLTASMHDSVCQTATSRSVQLDTPSSDTTKTEITLNQIKSILHAVLTEVKTNSQKAVAEDRVKKDAVVQNGHSNGNMSSTLTPSTPDPTNFMGSYMYSPYSMNPYSPFTGNPYCPAGARAEGVAHGAIPTGPYGPPKGLQQYPLFIQAQPRCTCCYRSIPQRVPSPIPQPQPPMQPSSAALDASKHSRNRETDNLVKEIYKSLYMDYAHQTSSSKSQAQTTQPTFKLSKPAKSSKSEAQPLGPRDPNIMRELPQESHLRLFSNLQSDEQRQSTTPSYRSEEVSRGGTESSSPSEQPTTVAQGYSTSDTHHLRALPPQFLLEPQEPYTPPTETSISTPIEEEEVEEAEEEESESISTDVTDSDITIMPRKPPELQKKEKKAGLFSKMKKLFTSKNRRRYTGASSVKTSDRQQAESSDDDYETVYSEAQGRLERRDRKFQPTSLLRRERYPPISPPGRERYPRTSPLGRERYPPPQSSQRRSRPHSKVSRSRYNMSRVSSSRQPPPHSKRRDEPYVEQLDFRRYQNKLQAYQSSGPPRYPAGDRARYPERPDRPRRKPPFWREYEARPVLDLPAPPPLQPPPAPLALLSPVYRAGQVNNPRRTPLISRPEPLGAAKGKGLSWLKKALPTMPQINMPQCGVQWKDFVMNS